MPIIHWNAARRIGFVALLVAGHASGSAQAPAKSYAAMAPLAKYLETEAHEIVLARSAAPASISSKAEVLALTANGYHSSIAGTNGWTCLVQRSWNNQFDNPEFWNPRIRVPICFNPEASETILPVYLERTTRVLNHRTLSKLVEEAAKHPAPDPKPGSFAIMMSRQGYLADGVGAAGPHVMVFFSNVARETWGADLPGSPVGATPGDKPSITIFYLPARSWSDGTPITPRKSR